MKTKWPKFSKIFPTTWNIFTSITVHRRYKINMNWFRPYLRELKNFGTRNLSIFTFIVPEHLNFKVKSLDTLLHNLNNIVFYLWLKILKTVLYDFGL